MADQFALLREPNCRLDLEQASRILGPVEGLEPTEMIHRLHDRPGILASRLPSKTAQLASFDLAAAGMPTRVISEECLIEIPRPPRATVKSAEILEDRLIFRSVEWQGEIPWSQIRLLDIVQDTTTSRERVRSVLSINDHSSDRLESNAFETKFQVQVYLEVVAVDPLIRMRMDRDHFNYKQTGLKLHTNREKNFQAFAIALQMRSTFALAGPGYKWLSQGNNSTRNSKNSSSRFENFATWLLTIDQ